MSLQILNEKNKNEIINFLNKIEKDFDIHLTDRVNIKEYVLKVLKNGYILSEICDNKIVGILLMYANDYIKKEAYISLVGVDSNYRNQHIATNLLNEAIKISKTNKMEKIKLYTHKNNIKAITMYEKNGFQKINSDREHSYCYTKNLIKENVIVTAIGSFSADIVIKSLHNMGFGIIGTDIYDADWIVDSKSVDFFEKAPFVYDRQQYIDFIKNLCSKYKIKYILPLTDPEVDLLCEYKEELLTNNVKICTSDKNVVKICRNKYELPKILESIDGLNIIKTIKINEVDKTIKYPIIIKPINGRSSQNCYKIYNDSEFEFYKKICTNIDNMIVQPLIDGNIITVDVVSDIKHNVSVSIPRRELLRTGNGAGTTVETFFDKNLIDICDKIVKKLNINGAINIEFIEKEKGKYYFLEINPRFSGGLEFSHIEGYNVVENHIKCFNNKKIECEMNYKNMLIARKYEEYIMRGEK